MGARFGRRFTNSAKPCFARFWFLKYGAMVTRAHRFCVHFLKLNSNQTYQMTGGVNLCEVAVRVFRLCRQINPIDLVLQNVQSHPWPTPRLSGVYCCCFLCSFQPPPPRNSSVLAGTPKQAFLFRARTDEATVVWEQLSWARKVRAEHALHIP